MRLLMLFITLLLSGCAVKKEVLYIPVACEVESRTRPLPKNDPLENLKEIFIYLEELENDLKFCKGEIDGR